MKTPRTLDATGARRGVFVLFALLLVLSAWIQDDAYITFRTVDNFTNGHGLTWNPGERVQTYTNPLWMLLVSAVYAVTSEMYFTVLALAMALSLATVYLVLFRLAAGPRSAVVAGLFLVLGKSFLEYSTSGLENPLTHLLIVAFVLVLTRETLSPWGDSRGGETLSPSPARQVFLLALLTALGCVNRPDNLLLFAPALAAVCWRRRSWTSALAAVLGFLPLLAWQTFALVYYGFLFPNTAYAKLGVGAPRDEILVQGGRYLLHTLFYDPLTVVGLGVAAWLAWRRCPLGGIQGRERQCVTQRRARIPLLLVAGCGLYLAYLLWIGGDYMGGRLLSSPLLMAVAAIATVELPVPSRRRLAVAIAVVVLLTARSATAPITGNPVATTNVRDERVIYYHATGLLAGAFSDKPWPDHFFRRKGDYVRHHELPLIVDAYVGFLGYYCGPDVHVVDLLGLGDPLLARLPGRFPDDEIWAPGHVERPLPEGYVATFESGENKIADPNLAAYYERLVRVTRGPLWDRRRWIDIWEFHTGGYRPLRDAYVAAHPGDFAPPREPIAALFTVDLQDVLDWEEAGRP